MRKSRVGIPRPYAKSLGATLTTVGAVIVLTLIFAPLPTRTADAASPASRTLVPSAASPVTWAGTAVGGGALNLAPVVGSETLCREGLTCDTFTLNVGGTAADWAGNRATAAAEAAATRSTVAAAPTRGPGTRVATHSTTSSGGNQASRAARKPKSAPSRSGVSQ